MYNLIFIIDWCSIFLPWVYAVQPPSSEILYLLFFLWKFIQRCRVLWREEKKRGEMYQIWLILIKKYYNAIHRIKLLRKYTKNVYENTEHLNCIYYMIPFLQHQRVEYDYLYKTQKCK
jgi:hypothetical protein